MLRAGLAAAEPDARRLALKRWLIFAVAWQAGVLLLIVAYAVPVSRSHPSSSVWILPPLAAVVGTAVPLQVALVRIMRSLRF